MCEDRIDLPKLIGQCPHSLWDRPEGKLTDYRDHKTIEDRPNDGRIAPRTRAIFRKVNIADPV